MLALSPRRLVPEAQGLPLFHRRGPRRRGLGTRREISAEEKLKRRSLSRRKRSGEARLAWRVLTPRLGFPAKKIPLAPEVFHYAGRLIHHADSASTNIGTAFGLLQSCILPRDARVVKGCTEDLNGEIAQALLSVSCYCSLLPF